MSAPAQLDPILRLPEVRAAIGLSSATVFRMVKRGDFPKPLRIGRSAIGWPQSAVAEWIASRATTERR